MGQFIFIFLFALTFIAGAFAYFTPPKPSSPLGFMMDKTGLSLVENLFQKKVQQLDITTVNGITQVRQKMDDLAIRQGEFLDTIRDEQQIVKDAGKEVSGILRQAQQNGEAGNIGISQLQALAGELQDDQHLLVTNGQDLIALNDQISKNRQLIAEQIEAGNINSESSLNTLRQRYTVLNDQVNDLYSKEMGHNQAVREFMGKMQDQAQTPSAKDRIQSMMEKEHDKMVKLADDEQRSRDLLQDANQKILDSTESSNDAEQRAQDLIDEEHQKEMDQQAMIQQRIADQEERIQDQQK